MLRTRLAKILRILQTVAMTANTQVETRPKKVGTDTYRAVFDIHAGANLHDGDSVDVMLQKQNGASWETVAVGAWSRSALLECPEFLDGTNVPQKLHDAMDDRLQDAFDDMPEPDDD